MTTVRFNPGRIVATPGVLAALQEADDTALPYLQRHIAGDWGELDIEDQQENEFSLQHGLRLLNAYMLPTGVKIWILTEADRSATTVLLPEEY